MSINPDDVKNLVSSYQESIRDKAIRESENLKKLEMQGRFNSALFNVLKTEDGKKVFKYIFNLIPVDLCSYSSDALLMAFNEGKRAVSVELRNVIKDELGVDALIEIDKQEI